MFGRARIMISARHDTGLDETEYGSFNRWFFSDKPSEDQLINTHCPHPVA